jgi:hypothetical protein
MRDEWSINLDKPLMDIDINGNNSIINVISGLEIGGKTILQFSRKIDTGMFLIYEIFCDFSSQEIAKIFLSLERNILLGQ